MNLTETTDSSLTESVERPVLGGSAKKIADNIRDALALSRKLECVLKVGHERMLNRDIASLEGLLETQVKLLNMLQLNSSLREHYLNDLDLPANRQGVQQFMTACAGYKDIEILQTHWHHLEEYANRCRSLNRANGRLLSRLAASTNKIIELVFAGQEPSTYNEQGICDRRIG